MKLNQSITRTIIGILIIAVVLGFSYFFWRGIGTSGGAEQFPIILFIWIAAILGSSANQTLRSDKLDRTHHHLGPVLLYILWKYVIAAILALALYMMFVAGLISGDIFPKFVHATVEQGGAYTNMKDFATKVDPESFKDVAKILVWSFIAGYSERFVPNLISHTLGSVPSKQGG